MKNSKGITLIALVITIIVLLILAGVSLSLVMGQNGTLGQASNAVIKNKCSGVKEKVILALTDAEVDYQVEWTNDTAAERNKYYAKSVYNSLKKNYSSVEVTGITDTNGTITQADATVKNWILGDSNGKVTKDGATVDATLDPDAVVAKSDTEKTDAKNYEIKITEGSDTYWFSLQVLNASGKYKINDVMGYRAGTSKNVEFITLK